MKILENAKMFDRPRRFPFNAVLVTEQELEHLEPQSRAVFVECNHALWSDTGLRATAYQYHVGKSYNDGEVYVDLPSLRSLIIVHVEHKGESRFVQVRGYDQLHGLYLDEYTVEPDVTMWVTANPSDQDDRTYDLEISWYCKARPCPTQDA